MISFLLLYIPPKQRSQVWILIYRNYETNSLIFHVVPVTSSKLEIKLQSTSLCYITEIQI